MTALPFRPYGTLPLTLANKEADLNTDSLVATLHTSTYAPNLDTDQYVSALTNELATSGGYTVGGASVTGAISYVAANSWTVSWAASTAYVVGDVVRPTTGNGYIYRCAVAGTSAATPEPTWPTVVGTTVTDSGVTWTCIGHGALTFDISDPSWTTFSAGPFRYVVISDRTPATAATQPLIALGDFGADQTGGGGTYTVNVKSYGLLVAAVV